MPVANKIPKPNDIAIGIKKRACCDVSRIIGIKPKNVVSVVNIIGLNLCIPALLTAS